MKQIATTRWGRLLQELEQDEKGPKYQKEVRVRKRKTGSVA